MEQKTTGYPVRKFDGPTKRYCRTIELPDDPAVIDAYIQCHTRAQHWAEIRQGIRQVGILEMEMYIHGNRVFMIMETVPDFDIETAMTRLATLPRQAEWEAYVSTMQGCDPSATSGQKWTLMDRMFHLYD